MGQRIKDRLRTLLDRRDCPGVMNAVGSERGASRALQSLIYADEELIRWRALEAFGKVAAEKAKGDLDFVKDLIRRQFWAMNDESGNVAWHGTETIGEILVNVPALIEEYGMLLVPFFHEEPFERGAYYAVARAARIKPEVFSEITGELEDAVMGRDPYIRCFAFMALEALGALSGLSEEMMQAMREDTSPVRIYDHGSGEMEITSPSRLAGAWADS